MSNLFSDDRIVDAGPHEFRRCVQRLMIQNGFSAFSIDGSGDHGGDLFCERDGERWIVQCKWKKSNKVNPSAIEEILQARIYYNAHYGIVATNTSFQKQTVKEVDRLRDNGIEIHLWQGETLKEYAAEAPLLLEPKKLRDYQRTAVERINNDLDKSGKALLYLATGLGKTVVAGAIIREQFEINPKGKVLVLAHMNELVEQLQKALWQDLPLNVPSQLVNSDNSPDFLDGLTVSTNLSIMKYIEAGYKPDLVVIDECHHVGESNTYAEVIQGLANVPLLGVTATPWRGDNFAIESCFGSPSYTCGIEEGMQAGYLAPVDYRLFCDNINWDEIPLLSQNAYSIRQLNKKLFVPQRDHEIIDAISEEWLNLVDPKCIVFCQSIEHAERFHRKLISYDRWKSSALLHSGLNKAERRIALIRFREDSCPILIAVDILNEGVDVPNVNIVCFARVTHSRKIFVQQLGRGLRVAEGKDKVVVLDFAADTRRLAAISNLHGALEAGSPVEEVNVGPQSVRFSDQRVKTLIDEWIKDAADLETRDAESRLQFPSSI